MWTTFLWSCDRPAVQTPGFLFHSHIWLWLIVLTKNSHKGIWLPDKPFFFYLAKFVLWPSWAGQNQQMGRAEETLLQYLSRAPRRAGVLPLRLTTWPCIRLTDARDMRIVCVGVVLGGGVMSWGTNVWENTWKVTLAQLHDPCMKLKTHKKT